MPGHYDVIVLGVGGMGSAACYELARRGRRVLGLEQYQLVHDRGSSHGQTRIIRHAYFEHPDYVPLARRAFSRWYDLEQRTGRHLLTECPCLNIGPANGSLVQGVRLAARRHELPVQEFSADALRRIYPQFRLPDDAIGLLEARAGFLAVEECVKAHVDAAKELGAELRSEEQVQSWQAVGDGVEVRTARDVMTAQKLIVTAGAWATRLLGELGVLFTVMRQVLLWFAVTGHEHLFRRDRFPIFIAETSQGHFYGLPAIDPWGVKCAAHYQAPHLRDPEEVDWTPCAADERPVRSFLEHYVPPASGAVSKAQVCMYTLTPDCHFVIDRHPHHSQVLIAAGFSGHGFKFASAVGEILADLVDDNRPSCPIDLFRITRFKRLASQPV